MKLILILNSDHFSEEENRMCFRKHNIIMWPFNFLPPIESRMDSELFEEPDFGKGSLNWYVSSIVFKKDRGVIVPVVWLDGR